MPTETRWTPRRITESLAPNPLVATRKQEPFKGDRSRASEIYLTSAASIATNRDVANAFDIVREARHFAAR
jgi:hypothetical protein